MDETKLLKLTELIKTLKDELLCPICLDIVQDCIEFHCGHRLCSDCYLKCRSSKLTCPVCKTVMKRRSSLYKDEFINNIGMFVSSLVEKFENEYHCKVEEFIYKKNKTKELEAPKQRNTMPSGSTDEKNQKTTTKRKQQNTTPSESTDAKNQKQTINQTTFDELLQPNVSQSSLLVNKGGQKRVYSNRKKKRKEESIEDFELLDFENDHNKNAVIQWLSDTRNKFDILTQTQNYLEDISLERDILPSVSQRKTLDDFIKPLKIIKKGRSRSADEKTKKRIYSSRCSERMDSYCIEDANTEEEKLIEKAEENVLLNLIEDEFLDNLETQFMKPTKSNKRPRRNTDNQSKASLSSTSNTGWERISEMKKSLKKKEPKQLKVLLEVGSHCPNMKKDKDDSKPKSRVEVEEIMRSDERDLEGENKENVQNLQSISIITIESHDTEKSATENTEIVHKEPDEPVNNNSVPQDTNDDNVAEKNDVGEENTCEKIELIPQNDKPTENRSATKENTTLNKNSIEQSKPSVDADDDFDPYMIATQKLSGHKNDGDCNDNNKTVNKSGDTEFFNPTQKLNLNITEMSEGESFICENSKDIQENISSQIDLLDFLESNVQSCLNVIDNRCFKEIKKRLHLISLCVTKLKKTDFLPNNLSKIEKTTTNISVQTNLNVTNQLVQTSLKVTNKLVQTSLNVTNQLVQTNSNVTDNSVQTSLKVTDQSVQTVKCDTCHAAAQTDIEIIDRGIQTTLTENSYSQNNSESFLPDRKTGLKVNLAVSITQDTKKALESFWSEPDILLPNPSKEMRKESSQVVDIPAAPKATSQNDVFTPSMDNLDFETQDLARKLLENKKSGNQAQNSKQKTQESEANNDEKLSLQASKESHLECSISSDIKKVNRKLSFISKDNKRDRISSDSDSDDAIRPRKKKRRIINSDISVEFESNTERNDCQKSDQVTSESDQINYDDCLNEILKNYDDGKGKNEMKKQSEEFPDNKTGETANNFLQECDKIIAEVNKNVENLTKKNCSTSQRNKSSQKSITMQNINSLDDMNITCGQKNSSRNLVGKFSSEFSDVIGETEDVEPLPKKAKMSKVDEEFNRSTNSKMTKTSQPDPEICEEFNDSFDEAELEKIDNLETKGVKTDRTCISPKVKIIQNIVLENKNNGEKNNLDNEDDLFSDEDVVETTPQKKKNISGDWEPEVGVIDLLTPKDINESVSQQIEDFDLDMALPPPPGFQDNLEHVENDNEPSYSPNDVTIIELPPTKPDADLLSLTPDDLSLYIKKEIPQKFDKPLANKSVAETNEETPKKHIAKSRARFSHSTPSSQITHYTETLGFSPIGPDDNCFEKEVKNSTKISLTRLSKPITPRHNLMTSTPNQKSILNYVRPSQVGDTENILFTISPKSRPCIACTRLSGSQISLISQMADKKLATFSASFNPDVTHMIVAVDDRNCLKDYTVKFVSAVAAGLWVLRFEWVQECLNHNCIIPEESFEALDDSGGCGPKTARLTRKENPLFRGFKFYCPNQFISTTRQEVEDILRTLGGKIVSKPEYLRERDGKIGLIITEGRATQDFDVYEKWLESFKIATVDIEWLSKSVGRYKILSIRPYVWCTDDNLGDYGYPDYLIENVPFTTSEQI